MYDLEFSVVPLDVLLTFSDSLSFTQGLLLGQLSVVLLLGAFIKFFIFGEASPPQSRGLGNGASLRNRSVFHNRLLRKRPSTSNILRPVPSSATSTESILLKTYYSTSPNNISTKRGRTRVNHSTHQPESLDWFNVLLAQTIAQYRQTAFLLRNSPTASILASLTAALNSPEKKPSFIDEIKVTDISLGEEFPIFSNCRVIPVEDGASDGGRLQALMDVDLSDDNISLGISTSLNLNYPKPYSAVLPVALTVSVVRFSGTLCISFVPRTASPQNKDRQDNSANGRNTSSMQSGAAQDEECEAGIPKTSLAFSFLPDYRLDISVHSLIGSRSRLQDVPKVAQLVESRVQAWFEDRVVEPRVQIVDMPSIWPRMKRTGMRSNDGDSEGDSREVPVPSREDRIPISPEGESLRHRRPN
ncbi:ERMES complex subunit mmm1 [Ascosphaera aggregata]|nr:ERMES complex subunit mmm1 [Ascosphaera aggregata]